MRLGSLALASLFGYKRHYLALALFSTLSAAVVSASLVAGASVDGSVAGLMARRVGGADSAATLRGRLASAALAARIGREAGTVAAGVLALDASASTDSAAIPRARLLGVDQAFFEVVAGASGVRLQRGVAYVGGRTGALAGERAGASEVALETAATDLVRFGTAFYRPGERTRLRLRAEALPDAPGAFKFGLAAEQADPAIVFVDRAWLCERLGLSDSVNMVLLPSRGPAPERSLPDLVRSSMRLEELGFSLRAGAGYLELRSDKVFLEEAVAGAASRAGYPAQEVDAWFADSFGFAGDGTRPARSSPFGFVAGARGIGTAGSAPPGFPAPAAPFVPTDADGAVINEWLAKDLGVKPGDRILLRYRAMVGPRLEERSAEFAVERVIPVQAGPFGEGLMPAFPGISGAESCLEWDPSIPLDLSVLRPADEKYWRERGGSPKLYLRGDRAAALFGAAAGAGPTAIRFQGAGYAALLGKLAALLDPAALGFSYQEGLRESFASRKASVDFSLLFLGLSSFLLASALVLSAMFHRVGLERRAPETGALLSMGFARGRLLLMHLAEGLAAALPGALVGSFLGLPLARLLVGQLNGAWSAGVGGLEVDFTYGALPLALSLSTSLAAAAAVVAATSLRHSSREPWALLRGETGGKPRGGGGGSPVPGVAVAVGGLALVAASFVAGGALVAFGAAAASLACFLAAYRLLVGRVPRAPRVGLAALARRSAARRAPRSLAAAATLAAGLFLVVSVGANPALISAPSEGPRSGSGGFAAMATTAMPADFPPAIDGARLVPAMRREGEDASCLNLVKARVPAIVGVDPSALAGRFAFSSLAPGIDASDPWSALSAAGPDPAEYPVFADAVSLEWNLGLSVGDSLELLDEAGGRIRLRIAGAIQKSIFQGELVAPERLFRERFPSAGGYRRFYLEAPAEGAAVAEEALRIALRPYGPELVEAASRLSLLDSVEGAYLGAFLVLGALGLALGSVGFALAALRNAFEDRLQAALMRAQGFSTTRIALALFIELAYPALAALVAGVLSSAAALAPLALSGRTPAPFALALPAALFLAAILSAAISAFAAASGKRIADDLRYE